MRFLFGLSAVALIAACGGASSSELFGAEPRTVTEEPSETEPAGGASDPAQPPTTAGAPSAPPAKRDAAAPDAKPDVVVIDASVPQKRCSFDSECPVDGEVCNWQTDTCAAPGAIGAPCKRDLECQEDLCNWKLTTCSEPAPAGTPCRRNKECASGTCSSTTSLCK